MAGWPGWQGQVLNGLGAIAAGPNLLLLNAWQACEGGSASFNPLNTTQPEPGATDYNSVHVKNYPSAAVGLRATLATLTNGFYGGIVSDLRSGGHTAADIVTRNAGEFSTWGTSTVCILGAIGAPATSPPGPFVPLRPKHDTPRTQFPPAHKPAVAPVAKKMSVTEAWTKQLTYALGHTMPHQSQLTRNILRQVRRAIR